LAARAARCFMAGLSRIPSTALSFAKLASPSTKPGAVFFLINRFCFRMPQAYRIVVGWSCLSGSGSLDRFAVEAARAAMRGGRSFVARVTLAWCTIRLTIEEKLEPILEESEELLVQFAPQVAGMV